MIEQSHFFKPVKSEWMQNGAARRGVALLTGLAIASVAAISSAQADALYRTEYEISMFGLSIARSAIETTVKRFKLRCEWPLQDIRHRARFR